MKYKDKQTERHMKFAHGSEKDGFNCSQADEIKLG